MIGRLCGPALGGLIAACSGHAGPHSESPAPPSEGGAHFDGNTPDAIAPSDGRSPPDSGTPSDGTVPSDGGLPSDSESPYTVISNADCGLQPTAGSKGTDAMAPLDGRCDLVPRLIVSPLSYATSTDAGPAAASVGTLVVSASDLYYTLNATSAFPGAGSVMRVALGGGLPAQVASGYRFGRAALRKTAVLYVARGFVNDAIVSIPLSGGPATTVVSLLNNDSLGTGLATDGANVYFDDMMGNMMGLRAAPLTSDSGPPPIVTITRVTITGSVFPYTDNLGVFDQNLIFTVPQGGINSVPLPAQANSPITMLAKTGLVVDLARCGSNACWFDQTHNSLELMSPSGGQISRVVLTGSLATAYSFAFDGTDFYVIGADQTTQTLARVPADGSCPADLVHMPRGLPVAVAVDGECVYWSNAQGIYNLAKVAEGPLAQ